MADRDTRHMAVNELRLAHKSSQGEHLIRFVDAFFDEGKILIAMECAAHVGSRVRVNPNPNPNPNPNAMSEAEPGPVWPGCQRGPGG